MIILCLLMFVLIVGESIVLYRSHQDVKFYQEMCEAYAHDDEEGKKMLAAMESWQADLIKTRNRPVFCVLTDDQFGGLVSTIMAGIEGIKGGRN